MDRQKQLEFKKIYNITCNEKGRRICWWKMLFYGCDREEKEETRIWMYSGTPLIRPPSESHWCGRIRGMVAREGFVYEQKPLSVTRNVVV